jgi:hypothetical protein
MGKLYPKPYHRIIINLMREYMRRSKISLSIFHMTLNKRAFFGCEDGGISYQKCFQKMFCTLKVLFILLQASISEDY